jgi:CRP/FNR family cyclic AMP-dependent transcriptional regulator
VSAVDDLSKPLAGHPFLSGLPEAMVKTLAGCAKNVRFDAGAFVLREGDEAGAFFLVRKGRVSLEVNVPGGEAARLETVEEGDLVGLSWMLPLTDPESGPARVHLDARALEPVVAFSLDGACLRGKMEADPELGYALSKRLLALTFRRLERVRLQRLDVYR